MNKSLKIWCTYHNENIPKEYNLYNTNNIQLFNNDDRTLKKDNINYLHDYLAEMTTYYYVWKNQIKTDYVGFCQYRRHFIYIDYNSLEKNGVQAYLNLYNMIHKDYVNDFFMYNFMNYMYQIYRIDISQYIYENKPIKIAYHSMFIYRWDIFNEVCKFMFGFLDYLSCGKWKIISNLRYLSRFFGIEFFKNENIFNNSVWERSYSVVNEIILGIFMNIMYNVDISYPIYPIQKYYIHLDDKIDDINKFDTWYKMNIKTGINWFYVNNNNLNLDNYQYIFYNKPDSLIEIKLKLNERIKCDDSIEFYKGNYTIEKFDNIN